MNRHQALAKKPRPRFALVVLIVLTAIGCGERNKGKVSGTVTYQGKPLPSGSITFLDSSNQPLGNALVQDGNYAMPPPIPVGAIKITVKTRSRRKGRGWNLPLKSKAGIPPSPSSDVHIPAKYGDPDQSGLTYTVQPGEQVHDIDLP